MGIYFKREDKIVFLISIVCIIWISLYKLQWTTISCGLLFYNADIWGDITYTIFTSILAAGLFYTFTIFIPRISRIKMMKKNMKYYLKEIDELSISIIENIKIGKTGNYYTLEKYNVEAFSQNNQNVKNDFITYYTNIKNKDTFYDRINYQKLYVSNIILNYSDLLPEKIVILLSDFCNISFNTLKEYSNIQSQIAYEQFFITFNLLNSVSNGFKDYFQYKNETI